MLSEKQEELANRQDAVRNKITDNLQQLARERSLIRSGQKQLVNMTDSIKKQLGESTLANVCVGGGRCLSIDSEYVCVQRRPALYFPIKRRVDVKVRVRYWKMSLE